jgi:hypothetical protein
MRKIRQYKYEDWIIRAVFECLEYLLKGLGSSGNGYKNINKEEQFIYLLVIINKEGFVIEDYHFVEVENWAYYVHFVKLLVRIINQADKTQER